MNKKAICLIVLVCIVMPIQSFSLLQMLLSKFKNRATVNGYSITTRSNSPTETIDLTKNSSSTPTKMVGPTRGPLIADATRSSILFPYNGAYIKDNTFLILGQLFDLSGQFLKDETVSISIDGNQVGTATPNSLGLWKYMLTSDKALAEGSHTVSVIAQNSEVTLQSNSFTVATISPSPPTITNPTNLSTVIGNSVTISGTGGVGGLIYIYIDDNFLPETTDTDSNGNWSITVTLSTGAHSVSATTDDLAFNTSASSSITVFTIN